MLFFSLFSAAAAANTNAPASLAQEIESTFDARRRRTGNPKTLLDSDAFLTETAAGKAANSSTFTDWIALAMGRYSVVNAAGTPLFLYEDAQAAYLAGIGVYVTQCYAENGGMLSKSKVTDTQRLALTAKSLGGNPCAIGSCNGRPVDLIADGSYNCTLNVTRQGIMGVVFALIAKNACDVQTPQTVKYSDEFLYTYILERELSAGGWTLTGAVADPDVTAMTLCALALHKDDPAVYSVSRAADGETVRTTIGAAVDRALAALSKLQQPDGGFASGGTPNCESCAQVLTALCMCGVDAAADARFLKNGNSVADALRTFRLADGGFAHTKGESGSAETFNMMATDQAAYALVALWRAENGLRPLYDMRPDVAAPLTVLLRAVVRYLLRALSFLRTGT